MGTWRYGRPDPNLPAIAENGGRAAMTSTEIGEGWSTNSQSRPPADKFNARDYLSSAAIKYLCRIGIAEYHADEEYLGYGLVIASNQSVYWNLQPCRGIDPITGNAAYWEKTGVRAQDVQDIMLGLDVTAGYLTLAQANQLFLSQDYFWNQFMAASFTPQIESLWNTVNTLWSFNEDTQIWRTNTVTPQLNSLLNWQTDMQAWRTTKDNQVADIYARLQSLTDRVSSLEWQATNIYQRLGNVEAHLITMDNEIANLMPQITGNPSNGYASWSLGNALNNGVLLQWRSDFSHDISAQEVWRFLEFPRSFPTGCWGVQLTTGFQSGAADGIMMYQVNTRTGITNAGVNVKRARRGDDSITDTWPIVFAIGN